ncbi:u6 snRNA-associated sm-like protein lsm6 [Spraguea lophii 42_110]|uniref:U6 snRNA-associated sm-like protein lsm6 n=1 Tax=Spraguea lophii (strain 42_110) TaxID=1358809 RepID=S7W7D6_SPRLO|nr:u6 snRNA-associated sm-like protein lsm6 [Spraguea lophii 42_110]
MFYNNYISKRIKVKTIDGIEYIGRLISIDGYLNLALESVIVTNIEDIEPMVLNSVYVKGNNIEVIVLLE